MKILTWIWFFLIFADVALLLVEVGMRFYTSFHIPEFVVRKKEFEERYLRVRTMNNLNQTPGGQSKGVLKLEMTDANGGRKNTTKKIIKTPNENRSRSTLGAV